jgi:HEAT repeat protein
MKSYLHMFSKAAAVLSLCALILSGSVFGAEREKTNAEWAAIAANPNMQVAKRVEAIQTLGEITDPQEERNHRVGEVLQAIAINPNTSIIVRIPAIEGLGKLQINCKRELKDKFLPPFATIFKDSKEHVLVRTKIALVFKSALDLKGVPDRDAFKSLVDVARAKEQLPAVRGAAMEAIGTFGSSEGIDVLVAGLSDPDVRDKAAGAIFDLLGRVEGATLNVVAINKLIEIVADNRSPIDLRVNVMKVLAQLMRDGNNQSKNAFAEIVKVVAGAPDERLVEGGIEALGIIGSAEAVEPLKKAYADFMQAAPAAAPAVGAEGVAVAPAVNTKDAKIREAVMHALGSVLATQDSRKVFEAKAVHESALLLVKALDDDASSTVQAAAVFSMKFLYPKKFKAEHKEVVEALVFKLKEARTGDELKGKIAETLFYITEQDLGVEAKRWEEWKAKK